MIKHYTRYEARAVSDNKMKRTYQMTPQAQQTLWSKLSNNEIFMPTHFEVEGDSKDGYRIMYLDESECGFNLFDNKVIRAFSSMNLIVSELNAGTPCYMEKYFSVGATAWKNHPIPLTVNS